MSLFLGQILTLLTTPPGNLIYHIVLVFSIAGALLVAVQYLRASEYPQARRTVFGLCIMLGLQLVLFIISGVVGQKLLNQQTVLPPLDRAVTLLTLVWIVWLWAFPEPMLLADAAALLLNLLGIMALGLTLVFWVQNSARAFNLSGFEIFWQGFSLVVVLFGILVLALRKPSGWGNGLAMLILSFFGHLVSLIYPTDGNFPGFVRLTQLAMFPLLLTLSQRFPTPITARPFIAKSVQTGEPIQERRRYSTDLKTFHTLLSLAAENDASKIGQAVTRGIAQAMLADLCFLITLGEDKSLAITCGYDLIREENLKGTNISRDAIPLLAAAIERGRPLHLPASSTSSDLKGLGQILGLPNPGHLLSVPVVSHEHGPLGGILILSPYSNRLWNVGDQTYLSDVSALFLSILERVQRAATLEVEHEQSVQEAHSAVEQVAQIQRKYEQVAAEVESLREKNAQSQSQAGNMTALLVSQEKAEETIEQLKTENEQLRNGGSMLGADIAQLKHDLRQALEETEHLQSQLAEANTKILELEKHPAAPITNKQVGDIASISQELRQPMSSIVGYTDLLLGESVGILGALQCKFLERIKASSERIGNLVDDLTQMTSPGTGVVESKPELLDLNLIIDNAMAYTSSQIREKNITLRLDLAEIALRLHADRDALQQILIHLLQNATAATRAEGSIVLRVRLLSEDNHHFLSLQVTDSGGGIAPGDIPLVFARRYRAEHALIQGLGDTGVGLSIAKTLIEAQDGRIWVETESGVGTTFSVLIPVVVEST
jgi:signal transduction histidine kinase